jgi:16S rRNA (cytosine967-C5)-methyltransferase
VFLRLNARFDTEETLRLLAAEGLPTERAEVPYSCKVLAGRPVHTDCFRQGRIRIQDLGSQRVVPLLALEPQHRFLDLCAAPGGKTFQALEQRMPDRASGVRAPDSTNHMVPAGTRTEGLAVACDRFLERLLTMRRLATLPVAMVALDAARELPFRTKFDRILVDAPCSGTGTLARNPEIKWKLRPEDIGELAARQRAMLSRALSLLAPAGRLVYSTCSLEPEENEEVVDAVLGPGLQIVETHLWLPGENQGDGFFACVIARR